MAPEDSTAKPGAGSGPEALSLSSRAVHADDHISVHRAVAPAMHVSTTFRYSDDPEQLLGWDNIDVSTEQVFRKGYQGLRMLMLISPLACRAQGLAHLLAVL